VEIVKSLIDAGASVDIQDSRQMNALVHAAYISNIEIAKLMIEAGT
jgi:uncharacterized protein